ncbi:MAG: SRPBCC family protein [Acidimicrobiales bacterium]
MDLTNDFRVALPVERAWAVLTDLEQIAPCMPGAQLQEVEGDEYRGVVKIKVGPITAQYKGKAVFVEQDAVRHVAVLRAEGRETRGQGNANATITATLTADGDGTAVSVVTDLTVTGRVAQFGRGVLADVSAKLLDQFVESLERTVLSDDTGASPVEAASVVSAAEPAKKAPAAAKAASGPKPATAAPAAAKATSVAKPVKAASVPPPAAAAPNAPAQAPNPVVRKIDSPEPQPVNLFEAAGSPVAKRVGPILAIVAVLWLLKKLIRRNKG